MRSSEFRKRYKYVGPEHSYYRHGALYMLLVRRNLIGRVHVEQQRGHEFTIDESVMNYRNSDTFHADWKPAWITK